MKSTTGLALLAAGMMAVAGCGGGGGSTADATSSESATSSDGTSTDSSSTSSATSSGEEATPAASEEPAIGPDYEDPVDMKDLAEEALPYLRCDSDADTGEYDIYGGLGVSCTGRQGESVSFDVYPDSGTMLEALPTLEELNAATTYYAGKRWAFGAQNPRTVGDLKRVLDPENAPEVEPLTKAEAKREYRRIVEPYNEALGSFEYLDTEYSDVSEWQTACQDTLDEYEIMAAEFEFAPWPASVQDEMDTLIAQKEGDEAAYQACIDASTPAAADEATRPLGAPDRVAAIADVREALGLEASGS